jgi:hypothetical protein
MDVVLTACDKRGTRLEELHFEATPLCGERCLPAFGALTLEKGLLPRGTKLVNLMGQGADDAKEA